MGSLETRGRTLNYAARVYDLAMGLGTLGMDAAVRAMTVKLAHPSPDDVVLDVGCATGNVTIALAKRLHGGGRAVGVDAAPAMIQRANQKARFLPVEFRTELAEALPFADETFDLAVNNMFLHHLPLDLKRRAIGEMFRVLRRGGRVLTVDIHRPTSWWAKRVGYLGAAILRQDEIRENLRGVVLSLHVEAGFDNVHVLRRMHGMIAFIGAQRP
ncbi:MAG: methyltransferase domain-containing protein [Planctomycetes bacterium]|nr:methyltransferase domain-containing protein [Planctomycetota bacterium]